MSLKDALTEHANVLRSKTGVSDTLSISDMTRLLGDLSWNKKNLLKGTSNEFKTLTADGWLVLSTASGDNYIDISSFPDGTKFTYTMFVDNLMSLSCELQTWLCNGDKTRLSDADHSINQSDIFRMSKYLYANLQDELTVTFTKTHSASYVQCALYSISGTAPANSQVKIKDERLYEGTEPGIWTPNPSDLTGGGRISHSASVMLPFYFSRLEVKVA